MADIDEQTFHNIVYEYKDAYIVEHDRYLWEFCPHHPNCNKWGYVQQHRLVIERQIGRFLTKEEVVHHCDENKLNNSPNNLVLMSRREHMALHQSLKRGKCQNPSVTYENVKKHLEEGGLKYCCKMLHVHHQTIRNHFPDLLKDYIRKSPTKLDDVKFLPAFRLYAGDDRYGLQDMAKMFGISIATCHRICDRHNIQWVKKSKKGEVHKQFDKRTAQELIDDNPSVATKICEYALDPTKSMKELFQDFHINYVYMKKILDYYDLNWVEKPNPRNKAIPA